MGASRSSLSCDPGRDDDEDTDVIDCVIADEEEEEEARLPTPPR